MCENNNQQQASLGIQELEDWLPIVHSTGADNDQLYEILCPMNSSMIANKIRRVRWLQEITAPVDCGSVKSWNSKRNYLVGLAFEGLVKEILRDCKVLSFVERVRTPTNEIDFSMRLEPTHNWLAFLRSFPPVILGEAKCYSGNTASTAWLNKLNDIMNDCNTSVGILFTVVEKENIQRQFRRKVEDLALVKRYILPFGGKALDRIVNGENFLKILSEQFHSVSTRSSLIPM